VAYVTIAGRYIKGAPLTDPEATWGQKLAGAGYQQARFDMYQKSETFGIYIPATLDLKIQSLIYLLTTVSSVF
jgi:hypothetical protein